MKSVKVYRPIGKFIEVKTMSDPTTRNLKIRSFKVDYSNILAERLGLLLNIN